MRVAYRIYISSIYIFVYIICKPERQQRNVIIGERENGFEKNKGPADIKRLRLGNPFTVDDTISDRRCGTAAPGHPSRASGRHRIFWTHCLGLTPFAPATEKAFSSTNLILSCINANHYNALAILLYCCCCTALYLFFAQSYNNYIVYYRYDPWRLIYSPFSFIFLYYEYRSYKPLV